jgi:hypothetical protein
VHNHGPESGPGLACRELVIDGRRVGVCLLGAAAPPTLTPTLADRLETTAEIAEHGMKPTWPRMADLMRTAAADLRAAKAENERLRGALDEIWEIAHRADDPNRSRHGQALR